MQFHQVEVAIGEAVDVAKENTRICLGALQTHRYRREVLPENVALATTLEIGPTDLLTGLQGRDHTGRLGALLVGELTGTCRPGREKEPETGKQETAPQQTAHHHRPTVGLIHLRARAFQADLLSRVKCQSIEATISTRSHLFAFH